MEVRKDIALEPTIEVAGLRLTPVAVTLVCGSGAAGTPAVLVREAFAVVVHATEPSRVLMADGRQLTVDELAAEQPSLAGPLAALERSP